MNKFVHYYTRFKNHEHSYKIEEPLLAMAKTKFEILTAQNTTTTNNNNPSPQNNLENSTSSAQVASNSFQLKSTSPTRNISIRSKDSYDGKHSKPLVKRISHSLEKGVSKLLTNQDWNILHGNEPSLSLSQPQSSQNDPTHSSLISNETNLQVKKQNEENKSNKNDLNEIELVNEVDETKEISLSTINENTNSLSKENNANNKNANEPHLFIEQAIRELLKARRILRCSYVYGYFLDTFGHKKFIFEFIQTEFEECTENLSQIIARPHLKTPKHKIIKLTNTLKRKRIEFIDTIIRGLNSFNDTPPTLKKYSRQRWKYLLKDNIQNDDEFKNTIALSLKELNPKNPWIVDKKGRHTNLLALLNDWPELEHELDSILVPSKEKTSLCAYWNCGNSRAVNKLSGSLCNYCSIKCMRNDHNYFIEQKKSLNKQRENELSSLMNKRNGTSSNRLMGSSDESNDVSNKNESMKSASLSNVSNLYIDNCLNVGNNGAGKSVKNEKFENFEENLIDSDLQTAIEMSKLQLILDSQNNENISNISKYESDVQKAIELSLAHQEQNSKRENDDIGDEFKQKATSSRHSNINMNNNEYSNNNTNNNPESNNKRKEKYIIKMPYESLFLNTNENDISIIIKNMENVLYEPNDQNKISKVCNFPIKVKK